MQLSPIRPVGCVITSPNVDETYDIPWEYKKVSKLVNQTAISGHSDNLGIINGHNNTSYVKSINFESASEKANTNDKCVGTTGKDYRIHSPATIKKVEINLHLPVLHVLYV